VDNIKMDLWETAWGGTDWIDLAQDRAQWTALVNKVINQVGVFVNYSHHQAF
jgi:hypothetical protein